MTFYHPIVVFSVNIYQTVFNLRNIDYPFLLKRLSSQIFQRPFSKHLDNYNAQLRFKCDFMV